MIGKIVSQFTSPTVKVEKERLDKKEGSPSKAQGPQKSAAYVDTYTATKTAPTVITYAPPSFVAVSAGKTPLQMISERTSKIFHDQGLSTLVDVGKAGSDEKIAETSRGHIVNNDGYWGVKQTAQRILDVALPAAGGNADRLDEIKDGIVRGFEMAKKSFGMNLPEVSEQTVETAMANLEKWRTGLEKPEKL